MKEDNESNRQRDEGKEENNYEDNRANFYSLHKTVGDNMRWNMDFGLFWGPWATHYVCYQLCLFYNLE